MKILHLSTTDIQGGAARGAFWLHKALQQQGVESIMFVDRKYSDDDTVLTESGAIARTGSRIRSRLDRMPLARYDVTQDSFWSIGWVPHPIEHVVRRINPDIVHLHWVGDGFMPISTLSRLDYPIVWTLRDMWSFTGGCHYTAGCDRYRLGCGACPQLRSDDPMDLSARVWQRKRRAWRDADLWLVPISDWLAQCARESTLFDSHPIEVIPNGVDTNRFRAHDAAVGRAHWDLPQDKRLILFGGIDPLRDPRKGFAELVAALKLLAADGWADRAMLVVFGATAEGAPPDCGIPARFVGHVSDDDDLARLCAAADVMATPSIQEAFGKTLIEAMACATPVVAFNTGGPTDIVDHGSNGYLATPGDIADFAAGLAWCLTDERRRESLAERARATAERQFDISVVASRYRALYARILARLP
ncbi:MAG TPA: glycosyltransferase family 4 protein [Alphaproteobacteria bacterium]|jgi:glycosyltransferase involved in cell wall biosynthesis